MMRKRVGTVLEVAVPLAVLAVWWALSAGSTSYYFPPLQDILETFAGTWLFERVASDVAPSLGRLFAGYGIAVTLGVILGVTLGSLPRARRAAEPIVEFLRATPAPALIPFAIVVFGIGAGMKIFIIAMVCLWPVLLTTMDGVRGVDTTLGNTARVYGIRGAERLRYVTLPAASPQIAAGMRTSLALALILMVVSEMVASSNGIGFFVLQSQRSFAVADMWSGILLLGLLGYLFNAIFLLIERRALRWHRALRAEPS